MPSPETFTVELPTGDRIFHHIEDTLTGVGSSTALRVVDEICVQLAGPATAIVAQVERSTKDPGASPNWAPAGDPITGNPSTGLNVKRYKEPTRGYWRVRIVSMTGASVTIDLSGQKA
jgi:hypothetical protein